MVGLLVVFRPNVLNFHWKKAVHDLLKKRERIVALLAIWFFAGFYVYSAISDASFQQLSEIGQVLEDGRTVQLSPSIWIGKEFPLRKYTNIDDKIFQSSCTVFLHQVGCEECEKIFPELVQYNDENPELFVKIEVPQKFHWFQKKSERMPHSVLEGCLTPSIFWFVETPVLIQLEEGVVKQVRVRNELVKSDSHNHLVLGILAGKEGQ